jgi:hypothetical protein
MNSIQLSAFSFQLSAPGPRMLRPS